MKLSRQAPSSRIFVSYRHDADAMAAGWLVERLAGHFGKKQIFKDVDSIEPGDDFVKVITDAVGSCDVLLALIGRQWLTMTGEDGRRRLDDPKDFVRLEIEAALNRDIRLIPVLIEGTKMPRAEEVPPSLAPLVNRQGLDFSSANAEPEFDRLIRALNKTLAEVRAQPARGAPAIRYRRPAASRGYHWLAQHRTAAAATAAALVAIGLIAAVVVPAHTSHPAFRAHHGWPFLTEGAVYTRPYVIANVVYFGSADGNVYAVNANSGALIWKYRTGGKVYSRPGVGGGAVYVGSDDGHLYALSAAARARHRLLWRYPGDGAPGLGAVRSSPILAKGIVYFGSENGNVYAISAATGKPLPHSTFDFHTDGKIDASPIQSPDGLTIYIGSNDGHVYALWASNGGLRLRWEFPAPGHPHLGPFIAQPSLSRQGDVVYVGSDSGNVYALATSTHARHRLLWTGHTVAGVDAQPTVWQGNVYAASGDYLYAWKGRTHLQWSPARLTYTVGGSNGPVVANGVVYVGSGTELAAFDAITGALLWHHTVSQVLSTPVVNNGNVYVGTRRGVSALTSSGSPLPRD